jgi:hypothetical protein
LDKQANNGKRYTTVIANQVKFLNKLKENIQEEEN